jgi:hypothetical protein
MRIVEPEEITVTWIMAQQTCSHSNRYGTEKLLEAVFSMQSTPRLHNKDQQDKLVMAVSSCSIILAFSCHVTIYINTVQLQNISQDS